MNDLEMLKKEIQDVLNQQIKLETIVEQAKEQCKLIEQKYNISTEDELKALLDKAEKDYMDAVANATTYVADARQALLPYEGLL